MDLLSIAFSGGRENEKELLVYDRMQCYHVINASTGLIVLTIQELTGPIEYRSYGIYDMTGWELWPMDCKALYRAKDYSGSSVSISDHWDSEDEPKQRKTQKKGKKG